MQFSLQVLLVAMAYFALAPGCSATDGRSVAAVPAITLSIVTPSYCVQILNKVGGLVRKHFIEAGASSTNWPEAVKAKRDLIISSRNLAQLGERMNALIKTLKTSQCQFLTRNDETYYFLRSLFGQSGKGKVPPVVFTGAIVGGVSCAPRQVRYVLEGSPAALSGLYPGDEILAVDGKPFRGSPPGAASAGRRVAPLKASAIAGGGSPLRMGTAPTLSAMTFFALSPA
jgi:hypothetical protein